MRAAIFVRYEGAFGLGHVGWAFDSDQSLVNCGGVENPATTPIAQPIDMGFWTDSSIDPVPFALARRYDAVKSIDLVQGDPAAAYGTSLWCGAQAYSVIGRNCMDDVYDVLRAYGVTTLPPPAHIWEPNDWFARIDGKAESIATFAWRENRPPEGLAALAALPERAEIFKHVKVEAPRWRIADTPESAELAAHTARASANPLGWLLKR